MTIFLNLLLRPCTLSFLKVRCLRSSYNSKKTWSRGSVPSSHARGQRFKLWSRQYLFIRRSLSWFGLASTPVESLPNLNPAFLLSTSRPFNRWPSVWFGSMLCGSAYDSTDSREISNDGNPSLSLHFKLSSLDGAQVVAADAAQRPAWAPSTIYTQHSIFRSPDRKRT